MVWGQITERESEFCMAKKERTTKEILHAKLAHRKRTPLYHPDVLKKLGQEFEQWRKTTVLEEDRKNWQQTLYKKN